jgi:hypothetical protein
MKKFDPGNSVRDSVRNSVWNSVKMLGLALVSDSVWISARDPFKDSISDTVRSSVVGSVLGTIKYWGIHG